MSNYRYRIPTITFNDGTASKLPSLTVIVGPNNVGKSRALLDVVELATKKHQHESLVVTNVDVHGPSSFDELIQSLPDPPTFDSQGYTFKHTLGCELKGSPGSLSTPNIKDFIEARLRGENASDFRRTFAGAAITYLRTNTRLTLLADGSSATDAQAPTTLLQYLYTKGTEGERNLSSEVEQVFKRKVKLDYTNPQHLRLRFATDFSDVPVHPADALKPMSARQRLDDQGDGIRAFATVIAAIKLMKRPINLIDEPELFLHPPQAYQLGEFIGRSASSESQFIIATHSVDFLRGAVSSSNDVKVIRIDRVGDANSFCEISPDDIKAIVSNPLLSSGRVLDGLFYSSAVVCEADADARFYSSAFRQLAPSLDAHFVAAENKQTVSRVLSLYRKMGVKHVGIVDFDMLQKEDELNAAMEELEVDEAKCLEIRVIRQAIADEAGSPTPEKQFEIFEDQFKLIAEKLAEVKLDNSPDYSRAMKYMTNRAGEAMNQLKPWSELKKLGRNGLSELRQSDFDTAFEILMQYGLCIYPLGVLESSLVEFGTPFTQDKRKWICDALLAVAAIKVDEKSQFWRVLMDLLNQRLTDRV